MPLFGLASILFAFIGVFYIIAKIFNLIMGDPSQDSTQNQLTD